jgi:PRC-barrel domain
VTTGTSKASMIQRILRSARSWTYKSGQVSTLIVGFGGFLGAGEKDVAVPFDAVRVTAKNNNRWYPVMNTTKDELKSAPGFTYDKDSTSWVPEKK